MAEQTNKKEGVSFFVGDRQLLLYINLTSHRGRTNKRGSQLFRHRQTDRQLLLYINLTSHHGRTNKRGSQLFRWRQTDRQTARIICKSHQPPDPLSKGEGWSLAEGGHWSPQLESGVVMISSNPGRCSKPILPKFTKIGRWIQNGCGKLSFNPRS